MSGIPVFTWSKLLDTPPTNAALAFDVTIMAGSGPTPIPAHKLLLSLASPVFASLLSGGDGVISTPATSTDATSPTSSSAGGAKPAASASGGGDSKRGGGSVRPNAKAQVQADLASIADEAENPLAHPKQQTAQNLEIIKATKIVFAASTTGTAASVTDQKSGAAGSGGSVSPRTAITIHLPSHIEPNAVRLMIRAIYTGSLIPQSAAAAIALPQSAWTAPVMIDLLTLADSYRLGGVTLCVTKWIRSGFAPLNLADSLRVWDGLPNSHPIKSLALTWAFAKRMGRLCAPPSGSGSAAAGKDSKSASKSSKSSEPVGGEFETYFSLPTIELIVSCQFLNVTEITLWKAVMRWAKAEYYRRRRKAAGSSGGGGGGGGAPGGPALASADVKTSASDIPTPTGDNLRDILSPILPLIRFGLFSMTDVIEHVQPAGVLSPAELISIFQYIGMKGTSSAEAFASTMPFSAVQRSDAYDAEADDDGSGEGGGGGGGGVFGNMFEPSARKFNAPSEAFGGADPFWGDAKSDAFGGSDDPSDMKAKIARLESEIKSLRKEAESRASAKAPEPPAKPVIRREESMEGEMGFSLFD